ncbi:MAG TPA: hypothetical protein EYH43_03630 [Persephonella sp.]|nr:hypothetical protein [Hydrogenothermaceae bacterium]HIQ25054.1 hypothetical protein [Persephonella sp.]
MFESFDQIKKDYEFTSVDEKRIKELQPIMEKHLNEFLNRLYQFIFRLPQSNKFFKNEEVKKRHMEKIKQWYKDLFSGNYDDRYFEKLHKIGEVHDKLGIPSHYINATFNFIRRFFIEKINQEFGYSRQRNLYVESLGKLLDINLDILTKAYIEEEISRYMQLSKLEKKLVKISKRFADFLDMILLVALILMSFFVIGLFTFDIYELITGKVSIEEGIIKTLGSLLILWAVAELMGEEIKHLRGKGFAVTAFISVALAAIIRKILIVSLSPEDIKKLIAYGFVLLILGIVYFLIAKKIKPANDH